MQNARPSGSKNELSIGVHASNIESSESKNEDISLKASDMKEIRQPAISLYQNELNLEDGIKASEEEYHIICCCQHLSSCFNESSKFWRQFQAVKFCNFQYASVLISNAAETSTILPPF